MKKFLSAVIAALAYATLNGAGEPFELTGQIMIIADTSPRRLHILRRDTSDDRCVWDMTEPKAKCASGDIVKVQGFLDKSTGTLLREVSYPIANYATNITVLSRAEFPETVPATAQEIANPQRGLFVSTAGTVVSVIRDATNAAWNWLIIQTDTGAVKAAATEHDYPYAELRKLLDAEVRIKGKIQEFFALRKFLGNHVILYGTNGIEVTKAAVAPFAAPKLDAKTSHRRQVAGTVVGSGSRRIYIRDSANAFISISPSDLGDMPAAGESVTVSGFVKNGPLGIQLIEAAVRRDGGPRAVLEPAEDVDVERLLAASRDNDIVDASLYGKPVRLRGRVANSTEDIAIAGRIMLECSRKNVAIDVAHLPQAVRDSLETGSQLEVCGICIPEFDADVTNMVFPEFKGLIVVPRVPGDIRVLRTPPWWTPAKLAVVIVALVLALVAILVWNRMLKVLSERRGRALYDEQMSSAISELKVEERTRLAVELHDSISQVLTGIALQIDAAIGSGMDERSKAGGFLSTARSMLASCRHELRCCIWDLRARTFEGKNLPEAIRQTLAPHIGDIPLHMRFNIPRSILDESLAHDMLRIIRELAVNAVRHGKATQIKVFGECRGNLVRFCVKDNGCGFDPDSSPGPAKGHFGLSGIRERVGRRNGEVSVESGIGKGTSVTVSIQVGEEERDEQ